MIGNVVREPLLSALRRLLVRHPSRRPGGHDRGRRPGRRPLFRVRRAAPAGGDRTAGERAEPAGAGQARVPRRGAVPPLPRCRRRVARPPVLRHDDGGAADGRHRRPGRRVGVGRAGPLIRTTRHPRGSQRRNSGERGASHPGARQAAGYREQRVRRRGGRPPCPYCADRGRRRHAQLTDLHRIGGDLAADPGPGGRPAPAGGGAPQRRLPGGAGAGPTASAPEPGAPDRAAADRGGGRCAP